MADVVIRANARSRGAGESGLCGTDPAVWPGWTAGAADAWRRPRRADEIRTEEEGRLPVSFWLWMQGKPPCFSAWEPPPGLPIPLPVGPSGHNRMAPWPGFERQQAEHQPIKHRVMPRHVFAGIDTLEEALHPALRQFNAQPASAMLTASAQSFDLIRTTAA